MILEDKITGQRYVWEDETADSIRELIPWLETHPEYKVEFTSTD